MNLPQILPPVCKKCGKPDMVDPFCSSCSGKSTAIDGIRSVFRFEGSIRRAIYELKYHQLRVIASDLSELLAVYLDFSPLPGDVFVPVPLHNRRMRERGYNQSGLIAQGLAKLTKLSVVDDSLIRVKNSLPQAKSSNAEQRRYNVLDAFSCKNSKLENKRVILLDDVCTSGATLESCAGAVKRSGALTVWGLTVAREV
jgi:ComF family protein